MTSSRLRSWLRRQRTAQDTLRRIASYKPGSWEAIGACREARAWLAGPADKEKP